MNSGLIGHMVVRILSSNQAWEHEAIKEEDKIAQSMVKVVADTPLIISCLQFGV